MPTLSLRPAWLRTVLSALVVSALSIGVGWWLGQGQLQKAPPVDPRRAALGQEAAQLRKRVEAQQATPQERQRFLELLVGLDRKPEAIAMLEGDADRNPQQWSLRLLLAELRRDQGDQRGAERELRQILHQRPAQIEALQLMSLVLLEQDRGSEAEALVKGAHSASSKPPVKPEAMDQGLLLAEVQQRRGLPAAAEATYRQLLVAFPADPRPPLGLALLQERQGNWKAALEALDQARQRQNGGALAKDTKNRDILDRLAAEWRLRALRQPPPQVGGKPPGGSPVSPPKPGGSGPPVP